MALIELRDNGELTQQSLCGHLHLDPTNVVAILNELERKGFRARLEFAAGERAQANGRATIGHE